MKYLRISMVFICFLGDGGEALADFYMTSFQTSAMAPNAGGQNAFALRRGSNDEEWSVFSNQYLRTGDYPLSGLVYAKRFPICGTHCFWQFYVQTGIGISSAGPLFEVTWGTNLLWLARIDFATQAFVTTDRLIFWSYPLWLGISLPL